MIKSKNDLKTYIAADRIIAGYPPEITIKEIIKNIFFPNYILLYLNSMRHITYFENNKKYNFLFIFHRLRYNRLGVKLGFTIGYNSFGYGLLIPHYGTIVVNNSTIAGNYCVLHTSTCIGGNGNKIGNAFYLSTGSMIMGKEFIIGDNISVASNSLLNQSIPESNYLVAGNPAEKKHLSLPWYERDGEVFQNRINIIEKFYVKNNLKNI